jgi:hypothetical protein
MREVTPHYTAGLGIRPPTRRGKVPGGGMELWSCGHDHATGVRSCQDLTDAQRAEAQACSKAWLEQQIAGGLIVAMPVLTEDEDEAQQAAEAIVIEIPDGADPLRVLEDTIRDRWPGDRAFLIPDDDVTFPGEPG